MVGWAARLPVSTEHLHTDTHKDKIGSYTRMAPGGGFGAGIFGAARKIVINTASSAAGTGAVLGVHSAMTPNNDRFQDSTLIQPSIKDTHSLVSVDMEGTTSMFMIAMVSLLVAIVLGVCCHACRCSPASLLKRREQREMSQMLKRNMELQEEIFAKEKVANIRALEHKMEEGVGGIGAVASNTATAPTPPAGPARGGQGH